MLSLRSLVRAYDSSSRSFAEVVPWFRLVTPGLVLNLDGSLLAAYEYSGPEIESSDDVEADSVCESAETAVRAFDDRNVMWSFLDKRRRHYRHEVTGHNHVARAVSERWMSHVDDHLGCLRQRLFFAYQPFGGSSGYFEEVASRVMATEEPYPKSMISVLIERLSRKTQIERLEGKLLEAITAFEAQLRNFATSMGTRVHLVRLEDDRFLAELSNRANVVSQRERVLTPPTGPYYLNTLLPTDVIERRAGGYLCATGSTGSKLISMHSVKGYPGFARNDVIESLLVIPADFTLCQMFRFVDKDKAESFIKKEEAHYRGLVKGPIVQAVEKMTGVESDRVNLGMAALADDAQEALIEVTADNVAYGYHSMALQVIADSHEENVSASEMVGGVMLNAGYGLVRENVNLVSAFAITIPGAQEKVLRTTFVSSRNLADLTVLRSIVAGQPQNKHLSEQRGIYTGPLAILPTTTDIPEYFHLHVGDVGHFFIIGPAGSGKTTLVNFLIICWQAYMPCRTIVLDKDFSNFITITALGGSYVDLRPGKGQVRMNPVRWANPNSKGEFYKLQRWLEVALRAFDGSALSPHQIKVVDTSINLLASQEGERSLSALYQIIRGQDLDLAERLQPWTRGNRYGDIFDHPEDDFVLSDLCGIEVGGLLDDVHLAPAVQAYLFEVVEDKVGGTIPTFIYLEEGWYLLRNEAFRNRFEDWIKTMRKRNTSVGIATQSMKELRDTPITATLNDNLITRIYLPNYQAPDSADVYKDKCGLRDHEIDILRLARQKGQYYIAQNEHRRLVDVVLPADVLALTRSDARAKEAFAHWRNSGREDWLQEYIGRSQ